MYITIILFKVYIIIIIINITIVYNGVWRWNTI